MLCEAFGWRQESGFVSQISGVARPTLGERAATQHGDARRAIDGCYLPDARCGAGRMPVLNVVAKAAVVDHVVELDGGVVGAGGSEKVDHGRMRERGPRPKRQ